MAIIRPVTESDSSQWLRMRHALWPDGSLAEHQQDIDRYFAGDRREPAEVLLAIAAKGTPVGFAELSVRNIVDGCSTDNVAYLEGWYVDADARGRSVGRRLIQAVEEWARSRGYRELASDTHLENTGSQRAHARLGFEETERLVLFRKVL